MKQEFIEFVKALMEAAPEVVEEKMTNEVKMYLEALTDTEPKAKVEVTEKGKMILEYLQNEDITPRRSKVIADAMGLSGRTVSGSMKKLVSEGFIEKIGEDPASYILTEKGKNYKN